MKKYQLLEDSKLEAVTGGGVGAFITGCVLTGVGLIPAFTVGLTSTMFEIGHVMNTIETRDALQRGDVEAAKRSSEVAANCMKSKYITAGITLGSTAVAVVGAVVALRNRSSLA